MSVVNVFCFFGLMALLWLRPVREESSSLDRWMGPDQQKLHVLSTTRMCASLVEAVGGENVAVYTLIDEDLDPHSYQLVKGDAEKFRRADLIFANGLHLEHGRSLKKLLEQEKTIFLGDKVREKQPELFLPMDQGVDPHFWMDVSLFSQIVPYIVAALSEKDPIHKALYAERGAALIDSLARLDREISGKMQSIPKERRYLVSSHDAFQYFARRYLAEEIEESIGKPIGGKAEWETRFLAPEGVSPDGQIGPIDIQKIIEHVVAHKVAVVFAESNISKDSLNKIVEACQQQSVALRLAKTELFADSMGVDTYPKMMEHNARVIHQELTDAN